MSGLDQARCVGDCLWSEECTMLMYNPREGMCVLGFQPCVLAEPHSQLMTQIFRQVEDPECLAPKAVSELDSGSRLIKVKNNNSLARLDRDGNTYIGSSNTPGNNLGYFGFNGSVIWNTDDHVVLTLSPWLPYTVGEPIPFRAVVCGRWNGKPIYMLKISTTAGHFEYHMYVIGYHVVSWAVTLHILIQL